MAMFSIKANKRNSTPYESEHVPAAFKTCNIHDHITNSLLTNESKATATACIY
jgi:hypothetical protein